MPVEIRLVPRFQLRTIDEEYTLELPVIELAPTNDGNLPYVSRISCSITGTPEELAKKIASVYSQFSSDKPILLANPQRLKQSLCKLDEPLPDNVSCSLQVSIEYFDSDSSGNPAIFSIPKNATATSLMFTRMVTPAVPPVFNRPPIVPPLPPPPPTVEISYPGWFALDFGTSNSTVSLFDPRRSLPQDVLPQEQETRLRRRLVEWLNSNPAEALPNINVSEWETFVNDLKKNLDLTPSSSFADIFSTGKSDRLLEGIKQIELCVAKRQSLFRKAASNHLSQIYHEAFRVPPLESQSLFSVELDAARRLSEIKSELQITNLEPLQVLMGERVKQERLKAIAKGANDADEIAGAFYHSPKRYFGQNSEFIVTLDGKKQKITVNQLIQAAWGHLIQLTDDFRQRNANRFAEGRFTTAVVTYPTIASPVVRSDIEKLVKKLGIPDVQIAYDEAVSVAIFFLWREFGGDLNLGIESFKTRCHLDGDKWSQNVLVLDIGGGTTDIALIRLTLKEIDPFESGEDRGAGGRYYVLTPTLLGSSGHLQLGGELITLWIFRFLKVAIADCLLSAVIDGSIESETLQNLISDLNPRFLENGTFKKGTLIACVDKENPEADSAAYEDALKDTERVIPTQWKVSKNSASKAQNFYTLWEYVEEAKLKFAETTADDNISPIFVLSASEISQIMINSGIKFEVKNPDNLRVEINKQQFEQAAARVIKQAISIAKGLVKSRLSPDNQSNDNLAIQKVDWLILSGKTCNFYLLQDEIRREFSKYNYFTWNPERVTFVPEFTKLATSAGACYAEKLRRLIFNPRDSIDLLRKGANQLYINVKNLFYFLPCSFVLEAFPPIPLFEAGKQLYQLDPKDSEAKALSDWKGIQLLTLVKRLDFEGIEPQLWGSFNGQALCNQLGMIDQDFQNKIKVQFEVNYKLQFKLLLCRGNPHYLIEANLAKLDLKKVLGTPDVIIDGKVLCDIAVNILEAQTVDKPEASHLVFRASEDYKKSLQFFHYENAATEETVTGLISEPVPPFPRSGKHTFYFRLPGTKEWILIGELSTFDYSTEYVCKYCVTLDEKGFLRLHVGEVPYCKSDSPAVLAYQEGWVYLSELELQPNDTDEKRDPFCGKH
ncbi:molecular chaperone [Nostoc calcicola FACHB-389]|nr:virulence factor SrfB [Nostoc calcicola FACHB-3891]OKH30955.1 molecular chaperone [Nostoc calcicola FACHB-389]